MNTQKIPHEVSNAVGEFTIGDKFRLARETLNLSLEDVSKEIALRVSILKDIENNQFANHAIPATFVRGYVRSYAKFLKIPDSEWLHIINFGDEQKNDLGKNSRATRAVNQYSSHNRWTGYLSVLVVLVVLGMTGMWWWESHQQSNAERDNLVNAYAQSATETTSAVTPSNNAPVVVQPMQPMEAMSKASLPEVKPVDSANTVSSTVVTDALQVNVLQSEMNKISDSTQATQMPESTVTADTIDSSTVAITASTTATTTESAVDNPSVSVAATKDNLYIEVTGNCWISVKDKNRKVLAQKEYKQGDVLSFNEEEPYSLIIGAPGNVRITYKGQAFPLTVDGRVAKFKLPQ